MFEELAIVGHISEGLAIAEHRSALPVFLDKDRTGEAVVLGERRSEALAVLDRHNFELCVPVGCRSEELPLGIATGPEQSCPSWQRDFEDRTTTQRLSQEQDRKLVYILCTVLRGKTYIRS